MTPSGRGGQKAKKRGSTRSAHRGVPVNVLSVIMGHSTVGVTQRIYIHLYGREQVEDDFRKAMSL